MESSKLQVELSRSSRQLTTTTATATATAAVWNVLGILVSHGRPARLSDVASNCAALFDSSSPDFVQFLCSIPNSPIRLVNDRFVTISDAGLASVARFLANCDETRAYLPQLVSRLLANFRPNCAERTYSRKRKRAVSQVVGNSVKRRILFQEFNEEDNINEMMTRTTWALQNGFECLPSISSILAYDCQRQEKILLGPVISFESCSRLSEYGSNGVEHVLKDMEVKLPKTEEEFDSLRVCQSESLVQGGFQHIPRAQLAEEMMNSVHTELSISQCVMGDSEMRKSCETGFVNLNIDVNLCLSSELETGEQIAVKQGENEALVQELLTENVNKKVNDVQFNDSSVASGHGEDLSTTYGDRSHKENMENILADADNVAEFLVSPGKECQFQGQGDKFLISSSMPKSDHKGEISQQGNASCRTMEHGKCLSHKGPPVLQGDMKPVPAKQEMKSNCEQNLNTKEKREKSMESRKRASSISVKNPIEEKQFPNFDSYVVEEEEGSGGYGTVYRARRKGDGVTFAIKCPHVNANRSHVQNELKMLERLGGRCFVIKYEGSFKSGVSDCIVLEHVEHDRPEILKREINLSELQWYAYCMFKALASLHKQGIVHRDVKPGNFLYSRKVNKGYLIDFNLALDLRKKYGTVGNSKAIRTANFDRFHVSQTKSIPPEKNSKLTNKRLPDAGTKNAGKNPILTPGNLKRRADKAKVFAGNIRKNTNKSQCADGSGITSAKDGTSNRTPSAERLREPLPSRGRKELISLVHEALHGGNHQSVNSLPISNRKRVAAPQCDADSKFFYPTPMPLHANGIAIGGAGLLKSDQKRRREGPCMGTKGFKAPEVLFRSLYQGSKVDIWSAGVTLLYFVIGRSPFVGDTDQNIKEIAKLKGSEDLWEVAKLHDQEGLFPKELLDAKFLSLVKLREWCAKNARRTDFLDAAPASLFDLVDKCLMVNPRLRISAEDALRYEFFAPCHDSLRKHRLHRQAEGPDPSN